MRWMRYGWAHVARAVRLASLRLWVSSLRFLVRAAAGSRYSLSADDVEAVYAARREGVGRRFEGALLRLHPHGPRNYGRWLRSGRRRVPDDRVSWTQPDPAEGWPAEPTPKARGEWYGTASGTPYPDPDFSVPPGVRPDDFRDGRWIEPDFGDHGRRR